MKGNFAVIPEKLRFIYTYRQDKVSELFQHRAVKNNLTEVFIGYLKYSITYVTM
ncbi:hypothetical protein ANSO36C_11000 [Nostoc cf. commune SO-36]|uniref:Transposase n=1 Tax=Nostoc cf. commune SO-36 TaxID=449208 RepID=A0ABN6PW66_NOSCO|nr:hypothetical protein ANSO36C_11000 [Nostoc cf. commune SO-36]